jgi:hypothetical protein
MPPGPHDDEVSVQLSCLFQDALSEGAPDHQDGCVDAEVGLNAGAEFLQLPVFIAELRRQDISFNLVTYVEADEVRVGFGHVEQRDTRFDLGCQSATGLKHGTCRRGEIDGNEQSGHEWGLKGNRDRDDEGRDKLRPGSHRAMHL